LKYFCLWLSYEFFYLQAQPSPTTGKFPFISGLSSDAPEKSKANLDDFYASSFAFKFATDSGSSFYHGAERKVSTF